MKMNNCFVLAIMLIGMPFFSCQGNGGGGAGKTSAQEGERAKLEERKSGWKPEWRTVYPVLVNLDSLIEDELEKKFNVFESLILFKTVYYDGIENKLGYLFIGREDLSDSYVEDSMKEVNDILFLKAVRAGKLKIVEFLLHKGADINAVDEYKNTALHLIMRVEDDASRKKIIELLIPKKIDTNRINKNGNTPLHAAAIWNRSDFVKQFFVKEIDLRNEGGRSALMEAASDDEGGKVIEHLVGQGANVNIVDTNGMSALQLAVKSNNEKIVKLLLSLPYPKGNSVRIEPDKRGRISVHHAVDVGNPRIVSMLLSDDTPWMTGAFDKNEVLKVLVNHQDDDNKTPLDFALSNKRKKKFRAKREDMDRIIAILKEKGAKSKIKRFKEKLFKKKKRS